MQLSSLQYSAVQSLAVMASLDLQLSLLSSGRPSYSTWVALPWGAVFSSGGKLGMLEGSLHLFLFF